MKNAVTYGYSNGGHRPGLVAVLALCVMSGLATAHVCFAAQHAAVAQEDFYPQWAVTARYLRPLTVLDTDSALGRRNQSPKLLTLKDMARMHGHLCDGLVTSWVELSVALRNLFPDGVVDRTDLRVVSKNGPCWADAGAWMTGARVNQGTLMLDKSIGDGFIVQRISTGRAVRVSLQAGLYPASLLALEQSIRSRRARGETVSAVEIDRFELEANEYSRKLLNTPAEQAIKLERLSDYMFSDHSQNPVVPRSDIVNRDAPRSRAPENRETR